MGMTTIKAVIFDLDGVIVTTDEFHYQAWARLAKEEGFNFNREINERFRGVGRKDCLEILIEASPRHFSTGQKEEMLARKNNYYRGMLGELGPNDIFPGVADVLTWLKKQGIGTAIGSSSKNATLILEKIGLADAFDAIVDGTQITRSKPDPEVFLLAANRMGVEPEFCLVIEDAVAGVEAALAGGVRVAGVGSAMSDPRVHFGLKEMTPEFFQSLGGNQ